MKRNRTLLIGLFTFALVCASLTFVGSTYAKYTSKITGTDTIVAAKYAWSVDAVNETAENFTFSLSNSIIAPGDTVTATITVKNNSDVSVLFTASSSMDYTYVDAGAAQNPLTVALDTTTFTLAPGVEKDVTITVNWANDEAKNDRDTAIGRYGAEWTIKVEIIGSQDLDSTQHL